METPSQLQPLPGDYIAGFVDGEGCFSLSFIMTVRHDRKGKPIYFNWNIEFAIVLRGDDRDILEQIKLTLDCGSLSRDKRGTVRYSVHDMGDLHNKIVPFFEAYILHAKKSQDFNLWKEAVSIFYDTMRRRLGMTDGRKRTHKTPWEKKDLTRLIEIHESMKIYKSGRKEWKWLEEAKNMATIYKPYFRILKGRETLNVRHFIYIENPIKTHFPIPVHYVILPRTSGRN